MSKTGSVSIDLVKDWASHLGGILASEGQKIDFKSNSAGVIAQYYAYERRFPSVEKKTIHKAQGFSCPTVHAKGLALIEGKFTSGECVRAHLNTTSIDMKKRDDLLVDWGIHHLHLGTTPYKRDPRFVERTGPLLYCRVTKDDAYFIGVKPHGQWTNQQLIQILHDNWPNSISQYRINGVVGLTHPVAQTDRKRLRKANVNSFIELAPGIVYGSLGGGFAMSGQPVNAILKANKSVDWLERAQSRVLATKEEWMKKAKSPLDDFNFKLQWENDVAYAFDAAQNLRLKLGTPN